MVLGNNKFYIESVAEAVRERIVEKGIIEETACSLSIDQVRKIVEFFDGELIEISSSDSEPSPYIEKTGEGTYSIFYKPEDNFLGILHELGHAFLDLDNMEIGKRQYYVGIEKSDFGAAFFARVLAMPRKLFEEVVIRYWRNGKCNIQEVAKVYQIEYMEVLARGKELNIWE